jgi:hypothetical protein
MRRRLWLVLPLDLPAAAAAVLAARTRRGGALQEMPSPNAQPL